MEHVAASLGHGGHLGDDGQVVDDERHLVLLVSGQVLRVAQQPEAGHVRGRMRVELVLGLFQRIKQLIVNALGSTPCSVVRALFICKEPSSL